MSFTGTSPFLTYVARFSALAVGPVPLLRGVPDLRGVAVPGLFADRHPDLVFIRSPGLLAAYPLGYWFFASPQVTVVGDARAVVRRAGGVALWGFALWGLALSGLALSGLALSGLALSGLTLDAPTPTFTQRVLEVAPSNIDNASARGSPAFTVGIASGAALGGQVLTAFAVRETMLVGGVALAASVVSAGPLRGNDRTSQLCAERRNVGDVSV